MPQDIGHSPSQMPVGFRPVLQVVVTRLYKYPQPSSGCFFEINSSDGACCPHPPGLFLPVLVRTSTFPWVQGHPLELGEMFFINSGNSISFPMLLLQSSQLEVSWTQWALLHLPATLMIHEQLDFLFVDIGHDIVYG